MSPELFSRRYNLRGAPTELIYDDIPDTARTGFFYIFDKYKPYINDHIIVKEYCEAMRMRPGLITTTLIDLSKASRLSLIGNWLGNVYWGQFLDLCELISLSLNKYPNKRGGFSKKLNALFREEKIGYEMQEGKIERIGNEYTSQYIAEARKLLKDEKYIGAQKHFEKAMSYINVRPNPDVENCVKDAVAAIESVGRIIVGDDKAVLSNIIRDMVKKGVIPKPLDQVIQKLYAYRGDQPGVAHGAVGASKVTIDEAEFVLATSAATIVYLVKIRSKLDQT